jgi:hypothetical protein
MFWWRKRKLLSDPQLWALAAGGILTKLNFEGFDELGCQSGQSASRVCLRDWWSVNNRDEFDAILRWLWDEGHGRDCAEICDDLRRPGEAAAFPTEEADPGGLDAFVSLHLDELEGSRLAGWDLSRLVNVARWGFTAGYIDEAGAWSWVLRAARRIQRSFPSWKALGQDFLLGYEFWRRSTGSEVEIDLAPAYKWLVARPESPWCRLPWDTPL